MRVMRFGFGAIVFGLALVGCKDRVSGGSEGGTAQTSASTAKAEPPSWVDNVTGEKFRAWVESHPGGCECSVTSFKKEGAVSMINWQIHSPGDEHYNAYITTVSEHGGKSAGQMISYDLSTKYKSCVSSDVGNKVIVSTRLIMLGTSAFARSGKHAVKECVNDSGYIPEGRQSYFGN